MDIVHLGYRDYFFVSWTFFISKTDEIGFLIRYLFLYSISTGEAGGDRNILQDRCIFMCSDNIYNYFIIIQKRVQKWWYVSIFNNIKTFTELVYSYVQ